jgi:hypothetical protein
MNRYTVFDYLVVCLDTDEASVANRIREIEKLLNKRELWPDTGEIKIISQKKCIETWFLGSALHKEYAQNKAVAPLIREYDILHKDPEKMGRPPHYPGSVGVYHCIISSACARRLARPTPRKTPMWCAPGFFWLP